MADHINQYRYIIPNINIMAGFPLENRQHLTYL